MIIVGVDPDSERMGVAIFINGSLDSLASMQLMELHDFIVAAKAGGQDLMFSIENVLANSFVYRRNNQQTKAAQAKVGVSIGRCQQSQQELTRLLDYHQVPYVLHRPSGHNWSKDKARFESVTGWLGRSNEDTRSAAYWGWLAAKEAGK